jgi:hypothetical protein
MKRSLRKMPQFRLRRRCLRRNSPKKPCHRKSFRRRALHLHQMMRCYPRILLMRTHLLRIQSRLRILLKMPCCPKIHRQRNCLLHLIRILLNRFLILQDLQSRSPPCWVPLLKRRVLLPHLPQKDLQVQP